MSLPPAFKPVTQVFETTFPTSSDYPVTKITNTPNITPSIIIDGPALNPYDNGPDSPVKATQRVLSSVHIINGIVMPNLQLLLGSVLGTIDASIPNKDQNKAVKHIVRVAFDDAYIDILRRSYPNTDYGYAGDYMLQPEMSREKAFNQALSIK